MLAFEELSFAENFTTSTKTNLPKIVEVVQVNTVYETIKELIELRDRSTSTLTVERLVKKFCQSYENLDNQQKQDVLLHLATKHYIKEKDLKGKVIQISRFPAPIYQGRFYEAPFHYFKASKQT